jgi:hypothetical protein
LFFQTPGKDARMTQSDNTRPTGNTPISDAAVTATGADVDNDHADERPFNRSEDAPENDNSEQNDEASQAQTVADEALRGPDAAEESQHGGVTNPAQINAEDAQDVVDHMNQMERSGNIDMDAYRGERNDDDEAEMIGEGGMEPDEIDEHGNKPRDQQFTPVE